VVAGLGVAMDMALTAASLPPLDLTVVVKPCHEPYDAAQVVLSYINITITIIITTINLLNADVLRIDKQKNAV
jgi:hypothetical protein